MENSFEKNNESILEIINETVMKKDEIDNEIAMIEEEFKSGGDETAKKEIEELKNKKEKLDSDLINTIKEPEQFSALLEIIKNNLLNLPFAKDEEDQKKIVKLNEDAKSMESRFQKGDEAEKMEISKMLLRLHSAVSQLREKNY